MPSNLTSSIGCCSIFSRGGAYLQVLTGMFPFLSKTKEKKSQSVGWEDHSTFGLLIEGGDS